MDTVRDAPRSSPTLASKETSIGRAAPPGENTASLGANPATPETTPGVAGSSGSVVTPAVPSTASPPAITARVGCSESPFCERSTGDSDRERTGEHDTGPGTTHLDPAAEPDDGEADRQRSEHPPGSRGGQLAPGRPRTAEFGRNDVSDVRIPWCRPKERVGGTRSITVAGSGRASPAEDAVAFADGRFTRIGIKRIGTPVSGHHRSTRTPVSHPEIGRRERTTRTDRLSTCILLCTGRDAISTDPARTIGLPSSSVVGSYRTAERETE